MTVQSRMQVEQVVDRRKTHKSKRAATEGFTRRQLGDDRDPGQSLCDHSPGENEQDSRGPGRKMSFRVDEKSATVCTCCGTHPLQGGG